MAQQTNKLKRERKIGLSIKICIIIVLCFDNPSFDRLLPENIGFIECEGDVVDSCEITKVFRKVLDNYTRWQFLFIRIWFMEISGRSIDYR